MDNGIDIKMQFLVYDDLVHFSKAVQAGTGFTFNFASLTALATNSLLHFDPQLILNIKACSSEESDNLLFLTEHEAFLFTKKAPNLEASRGFADILRMPFGRSTVLAFLTLREVLGSYKHNLEDLNIRTKELEQNFKRIKYHDLIAAFDWAEERLEDFNDLIIKLQATSIQEVEIGYISLDYNKLIAESLSLLGRYRSRRRFAEGLSRDQQLQTVIELNMKIKRLYTGVKRLTAVTILFVLATLIISQLVVYFAYLPVLKIPWVYPVVIVSDITIIAVWAMILRKIYRL